MFQRLHFLFIYFISLVFFFNVIQHLSLSQLFEHRRNSDVFRYVNYSLDYCFSLKFARELKEEKENRNLRGFHQVISMFYFLFSVITNSLPSLKHASENVLYIFPLRFTIPNIFNTTYNHYRHMNRSNSPVHIDIYPLSVLINVSL